MFDSILKSVRTRYFDACMMSCLPRATWNLEVSKHAQERIEERTRGKISESILEEMRKFDPAVWRLFSVSCGSNGRLRQTGWRVKIGGRTWVVILGYESQLVTAYPAGLKNPHGRKYAKKGTPFYKAVEELNSHFLNGGVPPNGTDEKTKELQARCETAFQSCKIGGSAGPRRKTAA